MNIRQSIKQHLCPLALVLMVIFQAIPSRAMEEGKERQKKTRKDEGSDKVYKKWQEAVTEIITHEELEAFKRLQTDEERDHFIEIFWQTRDPDPDTPENEYRDEHFRRIAYANEHYSSGIAGSKTDRGKVYIKYGPPDSIESHPAGGPYERPFYEGGGTTSTYPFEIWFYRNLEGVGSGIELEFVDPTLSGEFRLARDSDEKDALLYVPNAGLTLDELLGFKRKADRAAFNPGNENRLFGRRAQDGKFERLILQNKVLSEPPELTKRLKASVSDPTVQFDVLPFAIRIDYLRLSDSAVVSSFTLQLDNSDLSYKNTGGIVQASANIYARITSLSGNKVGNFEDVVETHCNEKELAIESKRSSVYQKNTILEPGRYKIDLVVRDVVSGHTGTVHQGFEVPRYNSDKLQSSTLIIADLVEPLKGQVAATRFIFGSNKVRPNVSQHFKQAQSLGVYLQAYNVQIDQMYLKPKVNVEYVITKGGKEVMRIKEDGKSPIVDLEGNGQQITLGRMIPLSNFEPGDYEITAQITDEVSGQTIKPKGIFTVTR